MILCHRCAALVSDEAFDFQINDQGTLVLVRPCTAAAKVWIDENVQKDAQAFCGAVVVEHRYARDLIEGILAAGFSAV